MGVWIETRRIFLVHSLLSSHPVWVCGLKQECSNSHSLANQVTPCMGVWIETLALPKEAKASVCHTLYGCVD